MATMYQLRELALANVRGKLDRQDRSRNLPTKAETVLGNAQHHSGSYG